jgi:hypothetical protein
MSLNHTLQSVIGNAEDTMRRVGLSEEQKGRIAVEKARLQNLGDTQAERALILMSRIAAMAVSAQGGAVDIHLTK